MRAGRPKAMRLNALLMAVAGAATFHSKHSQKDNAPAVAAYVRSHSEQAHNRHVQVANKTKRGLRRRQTRRRS